MIQTAIPNPASTVVLVRPDPAGGFEVFMNRRPDTMETYAGIYVFPGGRVEIDDSSEKMLAFVQGLSPAQAQRVLNCELAPEICLGHWVAAVRELFEEAGIYFFVTARGESLNPARDKLTERLLEKRRALQQGKIKFSGLLEAEQVYCDVSRLVYFFHRITPERYAVRFDTRFYLAALPFNQMPLQSSEEVVESLWIDPKKAVQRSQSGDFPIMPPTLAVLQSLANQVSWEKLLQVYSLD